MRKVNLLSALFFVIVFTNCKKDGEVVPQFDDTDVSIFFTDTFSVIASLEREDSIRTDIASLNLLGIYNDPVFGFSSSSIYSQITLNGLNVDFGDTPTLDSIVLTLEYADLYGNATSPMTIDVFEVATPMDNNTAYYSNTFLPFGSTPIASKTFTPNLTDSVFVAFDSTTVAPHLRINLGNDFGQTILDKSGEDELADNTAFTQFIEGLYITTRNDVFNSSLAAGDGSIVYFDVNSAISTVTLYYNDTSSYSFIINAESAKYSRFDHNYSGTPIESQLEGEEEDSLSYIQTMAGVRTKLEIPDIKNLAEEGIIIINKAELVVTLEGGSDEIYPAIPTISLVGINSDGSSVFLPDAGGRTGDELSIFGETIDPTARTYTYIISQHITDLIYNTPIDFGMYLLPSGASISANRSIIGTQKDITAKMRLNITYSKL